MSFNGVTWGDGHPIAFDDESSVAGLNDLPSARSGNVDRAFSDGAIPGPLFFGARDSIMVPLLLLDEPGMPVLIDQLTAATNVRSESALRWDFGRGERMVLARCERRSIPDSLEGVQGVERALLQFVATDPHIYGQERFGSTGPGSRVGGLGFPTGFPLGFGDVTANSFPTVNDGSVPAPWRGMLTGPLTSPTIELVSSGLRLSWDGLEVAAGQQLVLDSASGVAMLGGTSPRYPGPRRDWFNIPVGSDDVRLSAESGDGTLSMWWADTYL